MAELAGVMVGSYFLLKSLGREGIVETYLARPVSRGGYDIQLRIFSPAFPDPTTFQEHFSSEVRKVWRCQHAHIQPLIEFGEGEELLYTATEVNGSSPLTQLLDHQDTRPLPLPFVARLVTQVCNALHYAHGHDIVHGNIQPSSILLGLDGEVRLTNFGLRAAHREGEPVIAQIEEGNPAYVAPEQAVGLLGPASDIYAVGVVLFRLLGGVLPFDGKSAGDIAMLHSNEPVPSLAALRPGLPRAVELVVQLALSKAPEERFATPHALAEALMRAVVEDRPPTVAARAKPDGTGRAGRGKMRSFSMLALVLVLMSLLSVSYLFSFSSLPSAPLGALTQGHVPGGVTLSIPQLVLDQAQPPRLLQIVHPSAPEKPTAAHNTVGHSPTPVATVKPVAQPGVTPTVNIQQSPIVQQASPTPTATPTCAPGTLTIGGSFYLAPLLSQVGSDYQVACPGLNLTVGSQGCLAGMTALHSGQVNLASLDVSSSSPAGLTDYPVGAQLYAVVVSLDVPVSGLSSVQLQAIYQGQLTNWSQIGGPDEAITVLQHPVSDPLRSIFQSFVLKGLPESVQGTAIADTTTPAQLVQQVSQTPGSITYVPLGATAGANVHVLSIDRVQPTPQSLLQGSYAFWSVAHLYAMGTATVEAQSYIQFLISAPEADRLAQVGFLPSPLLSPALEQTHLPGPQMSF